MLKPGAFVSQEVSESRRQPASAQGSGACVQPPQLPRPRHCEIHKPGGHASVCSHFSLGLWQHCEYEENAPALQQRDPMEIEVTIVLFTRREGLSLDVLGKAMFSL